METKQQSTLKPKVYFNVEPDFSIETVEDRIEPRHLLMATPDYFDIVDVKNVHMKGNAGKLNKALAAKQWQQLKKTFETQIPAVLDQVHTIAGAPGCEDMVFCANQSFPWIDKNGEKIVIMSNMRHPSRQREVPYFKTFYESLGYKTIELQKTTLFEGMGDLIPHTGKKLLYGGFGHRTAKEAYHELAEILDTSIFALELVDERFYHLDTCFVSLTPEACMICKEAFSREGLQMLHSMYKRVHYIPVSEAIEYFALNAHAMYNPLSGAKKVTLHHGSTYTLGVLQAEGFIVYEVDTSEFMKSGGSVFCMKMMFY